MVCVWGGREGGGCVDFIIYFKWNIILFIDNYRFVRIIMKTDKNNTDRQCDFDESN